MYAGYHEEGDNCPENGCGGQLHFPKAENCSCHINPPCNSCTSVVLTCDTCGWVDDAPDSCYCACSSHGPCEHKWDGEGVEFDEGRGWSATCSRCGCSAMSHDMRCLP